MHNNWDVEDQNNAEIPEELRSQSKTKIYAMLKDQYFMPAKDCRGLSKLYLARVFSNRCFRVQRHQLLQFEANLQPDEALKTSFLNIGLLLSRMNRLLRQLNEQELGFQQTALPDEDWLLRVCRYIDPTNILGAFRRGVRNRVHPQIQSAEM